MSGAAATGVAGAAGLAVAVAVRGEEDDEEDGPKNSSKGSWPTHTGVRWVPLSGRAEGGGGCGSKGRSVEP